MLIQSIHDIGLCPRLWECQLSFIDHDSYFCTAVLKRRFTLLQSKVINADGANPGFPCELINCGKLTECIAIETYFASVGDTQTFITQYIREQRNVGITGKL